MAVRPSGFSYTNLTVTGKVGVCACARDYHSQSALGLFACLDGITLVDSTAGLVSHLLPRGYRGLSTVHCPLSWWQWFAVVCSGGFAAGSSATGSRHWNGAGGLTGLGCPFTATPSIVGPIRERARGTRRYLSPTATRSHCLEDGRVTQDSRRGDSDEISRR